MPRTEPHPIRAARLKRRLSQEALGQRIGVTKAAISKWESGATHPEVDTAKRLAAELRMKLEDVYAKAA